ncbi:PadR family transcriptional regulator [Spongiactinospora gelatinilytica]|uniref:PadR family transcriptional regulator n=1 Tax=Spongiactinospora gelatinilytica TaxID=2666298 RepID=A0A2W2I1A5_9ACTN|nr:PadR family transcriptional regulator [Spongiactinospora gelatinilytica]PZG51977.1 PadR family transcriptional regulator [Spongiactinospora gelatinilytica]
MAKHRKVANPLALAVLAGLLREPMHPYELGRRLLESGKNRHIRYNRGSLYMVVEQLRKAGFVTERETVRDTQRPERTVYAITDEGRAELRDWMRESVALPRAEYPQLGVALSLLGALEPAEAAGLLDHRSEALATEADEVRAHVEDAVDHGVAWVLLAEEEYRLTLLDAERRFVARLAKSLRHPDHVSVSQELLRPVPERTRQGPDRADRAG